MILAACFVGAVLALSSSRDPYRAALTDSGNRILAHAVPVMVICGGVILSRALDVTPEGEELQAPQRSPDTPG